jgi:SAM-dependent methyltransferase
VTNDQETGAVADGTSRESSAYWSANQPGFRFSDHIPGTPEFFDEVERHRYGLEPHIPELVQFPRWSGQDVLEAGCGIGTDAVQFARGGARYTGLDASPTAIELARQRFALEALPGAFLTGSATALPFPDESFDLVYSHGVIHHIPDTGAAVREFHRVLRPGGHALVMVYHRRSVNYLLNIMVIRRSLAAALLIPGAAALIARILREDPSILEGHRSLLREHGLRYLRDRDLFLSNNTDGPGNPLSKVFTRTEALAMFDDFSDAQTVVRFLNLRLLPGAAKLEASDLGTGSARRWGWHLYVLASK